MLIFINSLLFVFALWAENPSTAQPPPSAAEKTVPTEANSTIPSTHPKDSADTPPPAAPNTSEKSDTAVSKAPEKPASNVTISTMTVSAPSTPISTFDFPDQELVTAEKQDRTKIVNDFCTKTQLTNCDINIMRGRAVLLGATMSALFVKESSETEDDALVAMIIHHSKVFSRKEAIDFITIYNKNFFTFKADSLSPSRTLTPKIKRSSQLTLEYEWLLEYPKKSTAHMFVLKNKVSNHSYLIIVKGNSLAHVKKSKLHQFLFNELDGKT